LTFAEPRFVTDVVSFRGGDFFFPLNKISLGFKSPLPRCCSRLMSLSFRAGWSSFILMFSTLRNGTFASSRKAPCVWPDFLESTPHRGFPFFSGSLLFDASFDPFCDHQSRLPRFISFHPTSLLSPFATNSSSSHRFQPILPFHFSAPTIVNSVMIVFPPLLGTPSSLSYIYSERLFSLSPSYDYFDLQPFLHTVIAVPSWSHDPRRMSPSFPAFSILSMFSFF